ncbi:uncharacterized protein LOC127137262 [Lathyrus oleraceus]|uniref:uncharacterized protein LOC127137262 n=1 Tax=Pisum sativum TaxID=3888 RepID=UPI0021CE1F51|nr:uncharacterized protein LOC127137262 [Pisum sativum]
MVNRNKNVDDIIWQVRHDDVPAYNNLAAIVERIMVRNGVNFGLRRRNYTSPLSEYILQEKAPPRTKVPKFTKFVKDTTESTVEHVARYLIEAGDISNNEILRIIFFQSSLKKNDFTWFRLLKARCFTQIPEHELVEMDVGGLDYSIRKKLDTQYLRDMAQLADRVRQLERLKEEKARENKGKRVAYYDFRNDDEGSCHGLSDFDDNEIDFA